MSSVPSPLLKLELQTTGENPDSWGDRLNTALVLVENAIAKRLLLTLSGTDVTLTDTSLADSQARSAVLDFDGTISANINVIVPTRAKIYLVRNATSGAFTVTVKTAAGTGVAVTQGQVAFVFCDGTNVVGAASDAATLGGVAASGYARLAIANSFSAGLANTFHVLTDAASVTLDATIGTSFKWTLGDNRTLALSNPTDGTEIELFVTQDATGGRTITWPANVVNASSLTLASGANARTRVYLKYDATLVSWFGLANTVTAGGSSTIADITVTGGNTDVDAFALAGSPAGAVTFSFTIDTGAVIGASTPGTPALDFSGFAAGSTINIVNRGYIVGRGGRGGRGATAGDVASANFFSDGTDGTAGGTAIRLPSTACTISVDNLTGFIWGGGGGGGGGGATHDGDGSDVGVSGGGGGGGNGGGIAGDGGSIVHANGSPGTDGGIARTGVAGTGGAGADTGGTGTGAAGGAGGDYGAVGSAGTVASGNTYTGTNGAGGAAGKAINYNGGSTPTYTAGSTGSPRIKGVTS